jgi:beta-glucosidase
LKARLARSGVGAITAATLGVTLLAPGLTTASAAPAPASAAARAPLPYQDSSLPVRQRVADLLSRMTLREKVGQMTQAERAAVVDDPSQVTTLGLGSLLSGGGSVPDPNTPEAWADMVDGFQRRALATRLGIPLIYGVDAVHGHGNLYGATVFPHNIGLGATRNPTLVRRIAHATAVETRASGPQWNFAPCICVARDDRWGRTYEAFGEAPNLVIAMETAIDGLQGRPGQLKNRDRVLATAKHFAGDGSTEFGTGNPDSKYTIDQGIDVTTRREFWRLATRQYVPAIRKHRVGSVMPSFSSVDWKGDGIGNPIKMHGNRQLLTGLLKRRMGFRGIVISDYDGIQQLPGTYADQVRTAVRAGIDMFMEPNTAGQFSETLIAAVRDGSVPRSRINDAVSRILTAKFELGLFEKPYTDRTNIDRIGSRAHHRLARRAAAASQVLLKNRHDVLPVRQGADVYVAGSNADNIGNQAGGWTLTWQGGTTNRIPGTTILDGIERFAGDVTHSEDASAPIRRRQTGIVVVGETPYAEGYGDVGGPGWQYDPADNNTPRPSQTMRLSRADRKAIRTVCAATRRCVVVVVSGRPIILSRAVRQQVDGIVAAWLPGSEGVGVADPLFGRRPYTGRLSVSWPRNLAQEPINVGDADYDPLYPYGRGLRTTAR